VIGGAWGFVNVSSGMKPRLMVRSQGIPGGDYCSTADSSKAHGGAPPSREVFIRKEGDEVILSPRPGDWGAYFTEGAVASVEFMEGVEDLPVQERDR
jgi:virulence-associated protein VagC